MSQRCRRVSLTDSSRGGSGECSSVFVHPEEVPGAAKTSSWTGLLKDGNGLHWGELNSPPSPYEFRPQPLRFPRARRRNQVPALVSPVPLEEVRIPKVRVLEVRVLGEPQDESTALVPPERKRRPCSPPSARKAHRNSFRCFWLFAVSRRQPPGKCDGGMKAPLNGRSRRVPPPCPPVDD